MIPITQTKVIVRDKDDNMLVRGNCYAACIASILEMQITDIPNVEVLFHIDDSYYYFVLQEWLKSYGKEIYQVNKNEVPNNKYYIVSGLTERGSRHSCVYLDGKLAHDPFPTRAGLKTEEYFEVISDL